MVNVQLAPALRVDGQVDCALKPPRLLLNPECNAGKIRHCRSWCESDGLRRAGGAALETKLSAVCERVTAGLDAPPAVPVVQRSV